MVTWAKNKQAFTIVELLIVIVVIAILAAITIVAYTGIQDRAKQSALQSAASQASKKVVAFAVDNIDLYPQNEAAFQAATSLTDTSDIDYVYLVSPDRTHYCVSATNTGNSSLSFAVSDTSGGTVEGRCVRNLVWNPSSEASAVALNNGGGAAVSRVSPDAYSGTYTSLLTKGSGYAFLASSSGAGSSLGVGGEVITVSAWVKSSPASLLMVQRGSGVSYANRSKTVTSGSWVRIHETYTVQSGASSFYVDFGWESSNAVSGSTLRLDAIMATQGTNLYSYGDGSSPGWSWDGTADNSTSFGPATLQ